MLFLVLYGAFDLTVRVRAIMFPARIVYILVPLFVPMIVAPAAFACAAVGAWLWRSRGARGLAAWGIALALLVLAGYHRVFIAEPAGQVQSMLKLNTLPASLRHTECEDTGFTDVIVTCYFEIDPADFDHLRAGRSFTETARAGHSRERSSMGPDFEMAIAYSVSPTEYQHGGSVTIISDAARRHVIVDLYIE